MIWSGLGLAVVATCVSMLLSLGCRAYTVLLLIIPKSTIAGRGKVMLAEKGQDDNQKTKRRA
jgi:hypothetical protein